MNWSRRDSDRLPKAAVDSVTPPPADAVLVLHWYWGGLQQWSPGQGMSRGLASGSKPFLCSGIFTGIPSKTTLKPGGREQQAQPPWGVAKEHMEGDKAVVRELLCIPPRRTQNPRLKGERWWRTGAQLPSPEWLSQSRAKRCHTREMN